MLAGCPTFLSPRHKLGSMGTQRLDLPCNYTRKEAPRPQPSRTVSLSVEKSVETKGNCSLRQNVSSKTSFWEGRREIEDKFWEKRKGLKRFCEQSSSEESCINRAKRKRSSNNTTLDGSLEGERLSVNQLGGRDIWIAQPIEESQSMIGVTRLDPSDAKLPPLPLSNNPLVKSTVTEIPDEGDKEAETSHGPKNTKSTSSTSSETHSLSIKSHEYSAETGNGTQNPYLSEGARVTGNENIQTENQCLELLSVLVACVESISSNNFSAISQYLSRLGELASPEGTSIHRVVAYFTEALAIRVTKVWPHIFHVSTAREFVWAEDDVATAFRLLNHISPIPKFLQFTSNEIMLRALEGKDRVHIIDFDIKQGLQWPSLFQSLASPPNPPSHVRRRQKRPERLSPLAFGPQSAFNALWKGRP
ncbi:scarecrow-like protein 28 [Tasmannia lanceolata]|uniref:scarecrow-like protein 28 n=1 Tax=Tasmannia lanceolata TaxID=3420 RepID=UPI0040648291